MSVKVTTNNHRRDVIDAWALTADERAEFDYLDWPAIDDGRDSASFVRFRGDLLDLGQFEPIDWPYGGEPVNDWRADWHGVMTQSYFDAVVIRYVDDFEGVVIGHATW